MRFAFTDDQLLFRDAVADLLAKECPPEAVRWAWADASRPPPRALGRRSPRWASSASPCPRPTAASGMDESTWCRCSPRPAGWPCPARCSRPPPWRPRCSPRARRPAVAERWLPGHRLGRGASAAVQLAGQPFVTDAHVADLLIAQRDDRLCAVPGDELRLTPQHVGRRRPPPVHASSSTPPTPSCVVERRRRLAAADHAFDRGAVAAAAVLVGLAEQMLAMTVEYVERPPPVRRARSAASRR